MAIINTNISTLCNMHFVRIKVAILNVLISITNWRTANLVPNNRFKVSYWSNPKEKELLKYIIIYSPNRTLAAIIPLLSYCPLELSCGHIYFSPHWTEQQLKIGLQSIWELSCTGIYWRWSTWPAGVSRDVWGDQVMCHVTSWRVT